MSYPIGNLKKDYEDINENNLLVVAQYNSLVEQAFKSALETGSVDFSAVQAFMNIPKNQEKIEKVIRTANSKNELAEYVENLKNYIIATKEQIHIVDYTVDLSTLELAENDIVICIKSISDSTQIIESIKVKKVDGGFNTLLSVGSKTYYIDIDENAIISFQDTGETFDYYHYSRDMTKRTKATVSATSDNYYIVIDNIDLYSLKNGDIVSIRYKGLENKNFDFFKFEDVFLGANYSIDATPQTVILYPNSVNNFVFNSQAFANSEDVGNAGYIVYDSDGNEASILSYGFIYNSVDISKIPFSLEEYLNRTDITNVYEALRNSFPNTPVGNDTYGTIAQSAWASMNGNIYSPTLKTTTSYATYNAEYMKKNNDVYISGIVDIDCTSATMSNSDLMAIQTDMASLYSTDTHLRLFQLPESCRPKKNRPYTFTGSGNFCYSVIIGADGYVTLGRSQNKIQKGQHFSWLPFEIVCPLD